MPNETSGIVLFIAQLENKISEGIILPQILWI